MVGSSVCATPSYLVPLGEREIGRKDEDWETLLKCDIPLGVDLRPAIAEVFAKNQQNIVLAVRVCADKLSRLMKVDEFDSVSASVLVRVCVLLRYVLPVIVSNNQHIKMFGQVLDNGVRMGMHLVECLCKCLHLEGVTVSKKGLKWHEGVEDKNMELVRLNVVETLLLLKQIGVNFTKFHCEDLVESAVSLTSFYLQAASRVALKSTSKLLAATYLLVLSCGEVVATGDTVELFKNVINGNERFFSNEEYDTIVLPLLFNIVKIASTNDGIIDSSGVSLVLNALHCVDKMRNKSKELISLFALASIVSFPSSCIALNDPCRSFDSETPVHRGTYADILLEILSRGTTKFVKMNSLIVSSVIPYAANLSYGSALHVFRMLTIAYRSRHQQSVKSIVCAVHYLINRSICENIPLVIVLLKNSKLLMTIYKDDPAFEECEQLVSLVRNVNQELKQFGTRMNASDLEKFFSDPSCEHFTIPVLRPPQIDFDFGSLLGQNITNLSAHYVFSELEVTPLTRDS